MPPQPTNPKPTSNGPSNPLPPVLSSAPSGSSKAPVNPLPRTNHPNVNPPNAVNGNSQINHTHNHNQTQNHAPPPKGKKKVEQPVDPAAMYETLKNRIAALEEEEVHADEEERRFAEEAHRSVKGVSENAIHAKYIELVRMLLFAYLIPPKFAEMKRLERDHAKEKQKLVKDKDSAKSQLSKVNQTKAKMENLARELQKDNKKLRIAQEDTKRLVSRVEEAQQQIQQLTNEMTKRAERAKVQEVRYKEMPDIVVKVVCKYRAEMFFKISRKARLSRLFNSWKDRMDNITQNPAGGKKAVNGDQSKSSVVKQDLSFIFTHDGRHVEADQSLEEAGIEDGDEILAVEMMDLTQTPAPDDLEPHIEPQRQRLQKNWTDDPEDAKKALEEIFDGVVRERLKDVLRQYELRERHFECVVRSKELEVLLSRARAAEQKQVAESEKTRADGFDEELLQVRKELEESKTMQKKMFQKLWACCQEPNAEQTQKLFASLREEMEKKKAEMVGG